VDTDPAEGEEAAPRKERRARTSAKKERTKKEEDEALNAQVINKVVKEAEEE
jgi:small subunit ribosomal protein S2